MSDLISREALLNALTDRPYIDQDILDLVESAPTVRAQIVANISGGVLQGASSNVRAEIYALDFDLDTFDEHDTGILVEGDMAYLGQTSCKVDPDFVREVIEAPERYVHNQELVEQ